MTDRIQVTFAYPYTDAAGKNHNPDATASLPLEEGKGLLFTGRARVPDEKAAPAAAPKEK